MYQILCEKCGNIGFHASRVGAETRAEGHIHETDHRCHVEAMMEA